MKVEQELKGVIGMNIDEVKELVQKLYPELSSVEVTWSDETKCEGEVLPACWHLYTYFDSKQLGTLGIDTTFLPSTLDKLSKKSIETLVKGLKSAFQRKESE